MLTTGLYTNTISNGCKVVGATMAEWIIQMNIPNLIGVSVTMCLWAFLINQSITHYVTFRTNSGMTTFFCCSFRRLLCMWNIRKDQYHGFHARSRSLLFRIKHTRRLNLEIAHSCLYWFTQIGLKTLWKFIYMSACALPAWKRVLPTPRVCFLWCSVPFGFLRDYCTFQTSKFEFACH